MHQLDHINFGNYLNIILYLNQKDIGMNSISHIFYSPGYLMGYENGNTRKPIQANTVESIIYLTKQKRNGQL